MAPKDTLPRSAGSDSPGDRLLWAGGAALDDAELLGLLLGGSRKQTATQLAREVLAQQGGLKGLLRAEASDLRCGGIGKARQASVMALVELSKRLARGCLLGGKLLGRPQAVAAYVGQRYGLVDQESVGALYLDTRHRLLAESELYRGTLSSAAVEPRTILRQGLRYAATGLILFHTHPSGIARPSRDDLDFTRRLEVACEIVGIRLLDHLIVAGPRSWVSLRRAAGATLETAGPRQRNILGANPVVGIDSGGWGLSAPTTEAPDSS